MYCSECGVKASGKFCHNCGQILHAPDSTPASQNEGVNQQNENWEHDPRYETIIQVDAVRKVITHHAENAPKIISGEAILAVYDKVMSSPIPLEKLAAVVQPLYESWGIRTGKDRQEFVNTPIGRGIARCLCSMARHGQKLQNVEQHNQGCILTAELPSSVCSLKGTLTISLQTCQAQTQVAAKTSIPGQMYDWGKSDRCLQQLFEDLRSDLGLPPGRVQRNVA